MATPEEILGEKLSAKNLTIACAESCTGGLLASRLTDVPGSSAYVKGGIVSYAADIKRDVLEVRAATLADVGAISAEAACEMAKGVRRLMGANIGAAITGNAGPSGDEDKPVGLVYIAVIDDNVQRVRKFNFEGNRREIKNKAVDAALNMIYAGL